MLKRHMPLGKEGVSIVGAPSGKDGEPAQFAILNEGKLHICSKHGMRILCTNQIFVCDINPKTRDTSCERVDKNFRF